MRFGNLGLGSAIVSIIASLVVGVAALALVYYADFLVQSWSLTTATITDVSERHTTNSNGDPQTDFCPTVQFTTADGQAEEVDLSECTNPSTYTVGGTLEIYYNPSNPTQVQIKGGNSHLGANIGAAALGLISAFSCLSALTSIGAMIIRGRR